MKSIKTDLRNLAKAAGVLGFKVPVTLVTGNIKPTMIGEPGGLYTKGGMKVEYREAYLKKGWSNAVEKAGTQRLVIGAEWIIENAPATWAKIASYILSGEWHLQIEEVKYVRTTKVTKKNIKTMAA